jgi:hypothetical protein
MRFIYTTGPTDELVDYLRDRIDLDLRGHNLNSQNWFCVTVREDVTGQIVAGLACEFKTWFDVSFSAAIDEPDAITRRLLRGIFQALFSRAVRITALVDPTNTEAEEAVKRLGFVYEGFVRLGLDGTRDALLYGMLRQDCRYLPGIRAPRPNGGVVDGQPAQKPGPLRHGIGAAERQRRVGSGQRYH